MKENKKYYDDWDDEDDGLPRIISVAEFLSNPSKLPEEVIESVVRQGHKMMISGASKSGKSFLLIELAIALAEGTKWLGFQCRISKVMYINLEIDRNSLIHRFMDIYEALGIKPKNAHSISIWNLRGSSKALDELIPELIQKATLQGADVIILDPIYKVMMGDENNATDDDFDPDSEIPDVPVSRKGDLYVLGKHRVLCGDSTIKEDVDVLVNEKLVDMIFTDPPYNVDYEGTAGKIQNDKMEDSAFYLFLLDAFTNMFENTKKGGAIYVCHADTEGLNFRNAYKTSGFKLAECLIWVKNALVLGRQDYHWRHEPILYGWKEGAAHYFIDDRTQDTIWEYNKPKRNEEHPTMKPLELVGKAIANSSRVGEVVLDLFGGSGSTLIAADQLGRSAYLMELDEKFVDVIIKRFIRYKESNSDDFYRIREGVKTPLSEILEFNL
ncbi:MAG: DNA methyltransferase [Candidatus Cloacimonetes bacterium]|nr:DNA methyltransferase [Candidatus Cloacimonadota bacterium]